MFTKEKLPSHFFSHKAHIKKKEKRKRGTTTFPSHAAWWFQKQNFICSLTDRTQLLTPWCLFPRWFYCVPRCQKQNSEHNFHCPDNCFLKCLAKPKNFMIHFEMQNRNHKTCPYVGIEPMTTWLHATRSTTELRRPRL